MSTPQDESRSIPIPGFPGYRIDTNGTVWSCHKSGTGYRTTPDWHALKPSYDGHYLNVMLCRPGKQQSVRVNVLMLLTFVGPRPAGMDACHNDGNALDNRLDNLRWDTRTGNMRDAIRHGTASRGERQGSHKLTDDDVRKIRALYVPRRYSVHRLAREFGVTGNAIHRIVRRLAWTHVSD